MGKKIAVVSDIHGNIEAFNRVLEDISDRQIESCHIYCLGDLVGYGPRPNEVIETIRNLNIRTVLGNYDEAVGFFLPTCGCSIESESDRIKTRNSLDWTVRNTKDSNKGFLRDFEEQNTLEIEGYHVLMTHASPFSINDYVYEDDLEKQEEIADNLDEDIILFGHTHYPYYKKVNGKLFINPGSVGRPKDGDNRASYCVIEFADSIKVQFVRVSYDIEKMAAEIEQSELLDTFARTLRTGLDLKEV